MDIQRQILVIDDDPDILRLVEALLRGEGHEVWTAASGLGGLGKALDPAIDLIVLDLKLPDTDGIELARFVRAHSNVPILMLTGRADVASRIEGLDAGADDYLPKPFDLGELSARIRGLLRRSQIERRAKTAAVDTLSLGGWRLEPETRSAVAAGGGKAVLTEREFLILATLMHRAGSVVTRDQLQRQVAGRLWDSKDRSLDVHISRLRRKLRDIGKGPDPIKTVRGRGFLFEPPA
jgi:two-component system phosphate regulon response regulator OmpR